jgi:acetylornithine deacetylase/succinyl-diaminopimelate desuccinylase-like protein
MTFDPNWLAESSDQEEVAALTAELVSHRSYPGEEAAVQSAVSGWFTRHGLNAQLVSAAPDRPNVIVRLENGPGPTLLVNGHVDTVLAVDGWDGDPWQARREGDRLYGLGACDMKSGVAAAMFATRALAQSRDLWRGTLIFTSVVDEEAYSVGAHAVIDAGIEADYCVVTESAWESPCLGSVGKILVRLDVTGKASHATWPERGVNAAIEAARFVARLNEVQLGSHPRMLPSQTVLSFHSGSEQYVITLPERARVLINRHTVPGETAETVLAQYRALAAQLDSPATFDFSIDPPFYPPWETNLAHPLVESFARAYEAEAGRPPIYGYWGFGDPNLFSGEAGIPTVMAGPHGAGFHEANEWVGVPSIGATIRVLLRLICDLLPPPRP